jgi:hypothetical protein
MARDPNAFLWDVRTAADAIARIKSGDIGPALLHLGFRGLADVVLQPINAFLVWYCAIVLARALRACNKARRQLVVDCYGDRLLRRVLGRQSSRNRNGSAFRAASALFKTALTSGQGWPVIDPRMYHSRNSGRSLPAWTFSSPRANAASASRSIFDLAIVSVLLDAPGCRLHGETPEDFIPLLSRQTHSR